MNNIEKMTAVRTCSPSFFAVMLVFSGVLTAYVLASSYAASAAHKIESASVSASETARITDHFHHQSAHHIIEGQIADRAPSKDCLAECAEDYAFSLTRNDFWVQSLKDRQTTDASWPSYFSCVHEPFIEDYAHRPPEPASRNNSYGANLVLRLNARLRL